MKQFFITYELSIHHYMGLDRGKPETKGRIVNAISEDFAQDKLIAYYEEQDEPYSHTHHVDILSITETLK